MWRLGSRVLGTAPTIIAAIRDDASPDAVAAAVGAGVHAVELRIDSFSMHTPVQVVEAVQALAVAPSLATIRHASEGGDWHAGEEERLALYRAVLPHVDGVDCELGQAETARELFREARAQGKLTIGSHHNFTDCPDEATLHGLVDSANSVGAEIIKVAAYCRGSEEFRRLALFTLQQYERGVIVIGMGPAGTASRVFFPFLGSLLTYTFLGKPTAPGQLNSETIVTYVNALSGGAL
jgi:3-dehydroquinate dehydratase-1